MLKWIMLTSVLLLPACSSCEDQLPEPPVAIDEEVKDTGGPSITPEELAFYGADPTTPTAMTGPTPKEWGAWLLGDWVATFSGRSWRIQFLDDGKMTFYTIDLDGKEVKGESRFMLGDDRMIRFLEFPSRKTKTIPLFMKDPKKLILAMQVSGGGSFAVLTFERYNEAVGMPKPVTNFGHEPPSP